MSWLVYTYGLKYSAEVDRIIYNELIIPLQHDI